MQRCQATSQRIGSSCTIQDCVPMGPAERGALAALITRTASAAASAKGAAARVAERANANKAKCDAMERRVNELERGTESLSGNAAATAGKIAEYEGVLRATKQALWNVAVSLVSFTLFRFMRPPKPETAATASQPKTAPTSSRDHKLARSPDARLASARDDQQTRSVGFRGVYESPGDDPQTLPPPPPPEEDPHITIMPSNRKTRRSWVSASDQLPSRFMRQRKAEEGDPLIITPPDRETRHRWVSASNQLALREDDGCIRLPGDAPRGRDARPALAFGAVNPLLELYEFRPPTPPPPPLPSLGYPPGTVIG